MRRCLLDFKQTAMSAKESTEYYAREFWEMSGKELEWHLAVEDRFVAFFTACCNSGGAQVRNYLEDVVKFGLEESLADENYLEFCVRLAYRAVFAPQTLVSFYFPALKLYATSLGDYCFLLVCKEGEEAKFEAMAREFGLFLRYKRELGEPKREGETERKRI